MFGDAILKLRTKWKELWCIHDYKYLYQVDCGPYLGFDLYRCTKCGKVKSVKMW